MTHHFTTYRARIGERVASRDRNCGAFAQRARYTKMADGVWVVWREALPGRVAIVLPDQIFWETPCYWLAAADPMHPIADTLAFVEAGGLTRLQSLPRGRDPSSAHRLFTDTLALRIGVLAWHDPALEAWVTTQAARLVRVPPEVKVKPGRPAPPRPQPLPELVPTMRQVLGLHLDDTADGHPSLQLIGGA